MIDEDIVFDFITAKMLKKNERVVFANNLLYNDSVSGDYHIYKIVTIDEFGKVRAYVKDIQSSGEYIQVGKI